MKINMHTIRKLIILLLLANLSNSCSNKLIIPDSKHDCFDTSLSGVSILDSVTISGFFIKIETPEKSFLDIFIPDSMNIGINARSIIKELTKLDPKNWSFDYCPWSFESSFTIDTFFINSTKYSGKYFVSYELYMLPDSISEGRFKYKDYVFYYKYVNDYKFLRSKVLTEEINRYNSHPRNSVGTIDFIQLNFYQFNNKVDSIEILLPHSFIQNR